MVSIKNIFTDLYFIMNAFDFDKLALYGVGLIKIHANNDLKNLLGMTNFEEF